MSKKYDWSAECAALTSDEFRLTIPVSPMLAEAQQLAQFVRAHHKIDKKKDLPGLGDAKLPLSIADEIDSLVAATSSAQSDYTMSVDPKADGSKMQRARYIIDEIQGVMTYFLDDGVEDDDDVRLANVAAAHKDDAPTSANYALALDEWSALAAMHEKEIDGLGGFDASLIKEAKKLATELRSGGPVSPPSPVSTANLQKRNRLLQLLDARVRRVRSAARFVFRAHPEVAREVSSAYERKRRIDAKRAATRKKHEPAQPAAGNNGQPTPPVTPASHA